MCGISGIVGQDANATFLKKLLEPISHRGEVKYRDETLVLSGVAVGAHRLAIVGEPTGKQPKQSQDQKICSVFNGEIYNHAELRQELTKSGPFLSLCDSEVVLRSYSEWGENFVQYLDGKYAIAIYDDEKKALIMVRDPMGVKPLYYAKYKDSWIFSSEAKSLTSIQDEHLEIHELEPGTIWINGITTRYFTPPHFCQGQSSDLPTSAYIPELSDYLTQAVKKRIPEEASSVACLLSGGIDSSIITYLASKIHPRVVAYTLAAHNTPSSDLQAAQILCDRLKIEHIIVSPPIKEMQDFYLQKGVYMTESFEPVLVRNAVSYNFVCRKIVEDGFKYCLCGEGADELFGGYDFVREVDVSDQDKIIWHSLSIIHKTYLHMADRASMYTTLEARVPYMDKNLVSFCLSLPPKARINGDINKAILRELFQDELPESITSRRKSGMNEGAGFGINSSKESIYHNAVKDYYEQNPRAYDEDMALCQKKASHVSVDWSSIEEIYNLAQFIKLGFIKQSVSQR